MNVRVPGEGETGAFYGVLGFMGAVLVGLLYYFRRRGFL
jgi:LPXTG-motif cell wall-anchored protein